MKKGLLLVSSLQEWAMKESLIISSTRDMREGTVGVFIYLFIYFRGKGLVLVVAIVFALSNNMMALRRTFWSIARANREWMTRTPLHHFFFGAAFLAAAAFGLEGEATFLGFGALGFFVGALVTFFTLEGAFLGFFGEAATLRLATAAAAVTLRLPPAALVPAAFLALGATAFFFVGFAAGAGRFLPAFSPLFSGFPAVAGSLNEPDAPLPSNTQEIG